MVWCSILGTKIRIKNEYEAIMNLKKFRLTAAVPDLTFGKMVQIDGCD